MNLTSSLERAYADQRGSILLGGLMLVLVATLVGVAIFDVSLVESRQQGRTLIDVRAFYAADAGIHRAGLDMADPNPANPVGALSFAGIKAALPNNNTALTTLAGYGSTCFGSTTCDGSHNPTNPAYLVQARNITADPTQFQLISTACVPGPASNPCPDGSRTAQVQGTLRRTTVNTFQWAAFGNNSLGMSGNGGVADSYNSHKVGCAVPCPYGGTNVGSKGNLGSNGAIDLGVTTTITVKGNVLNTTNVVADPSDINIGSNVTLQGNVMSGGTIVVGGVTNPTTSSGVTGTITHDTASSQVIMAALPNCGPPYADLTGKITQYTNNTYAVPVGSPTWTYGGTKNCGTCGVTGSKAGQLVAGGGAFISIAPGAYCLSDVTFSGGTSVRVTDLTIMTVDGQFTLGGGGLDNTSHLPQDLQLISTYGNDAGETHTGVTLSGGSDGYMTIYAPTTGVVVGGGGDLYGGVMGNTVSFTGGSKVHFDEFLSTGGAGLVGGISVSTFAMIGWRQIACGYGTFPC